MTPNPNIYNQFSADQFAADEYFRQWVLDADSTQDQYWKDYQLLHPEQKDAIGKGRQLVEEQIFPKDQELTEDQELAANQTCNNNNNNNNQALTGEEKRILKDNIFRHLNLTGAAGEISSAKLSSAGPSSTDPFSGKTSFAGPSAEQPSIPVRRIRPGRWTLLVAAAAVVAVILVSAWFLDYIGKGIGKPIQQFSERTGANEMKKIMLADSTVVILNASSSLTYSSDFPKNANREVRLEGNAYFIVKKDPAYREFVVHTKTLSITVLGTEFNVNARSAATEVTLTSGKVRVMNNVQQRVPLYLLPGDKVSLDTGRQEFVRTSINPQLYAAWTEGNWNFRQTSLEEITGLLREYYGTETVFRNERSRHFRINAVIPVGSLEKLLPVLAETLRIRISQSGKKIIID
jgi:transmembrane sensor